MHKILVSDPLPNDIVESLKKEADVTVSTGMTPAQLAEKVAGFDALVVRSQSKVTREVIEGGKDLKIIGRAGVGVDNIDVEAATQRGIMVVNSPEGNTISAAEHTFGMLLAAARFIPQADASMRRGEWDRKTFTGYELYNKTLGVIGFGRIGREVACRAASFRMKILAYDPFVSADHIREKGAEPGTLDEILEKSDFLTLHLPKTKETEGLFDAARLARLKKTAILVNCARGGILDEQALADALREKRIAAAALDVFANEPLGESPLLGLPNIVTTPHLAASTHEAQERVAVDVAEQILEVLRGGAPRSAVNIPYIPPEELGFLKPYLSLSEKIGRLLATVCDGAPQKVTIEYRGEVSKADISLLSKAVLKGLLSHGSPETVNYVNATLVARERGISLSESRNQKSPTYTSLISVSVQTEQKTRSLVGTVFADGQPRVVELDGYPISMVLEGSKLITWQNDCPGVVGRVGSLLGQHDINIADMVVGRRHARTQAVMVMSVDEKPGTDVVSAVKSLTGIEEARLVQL